MDGQRGFTAGDIFPRAIEGVAPRFGRASPADGTCRADGGQRIRIRRAALAARRFGDPGVVLPARGVLWRARSGRFSAVAGPDRSFSGRGGGSGPEADSAGVAG